MRYSIVIALLVLAACQPVPKPFSQAGAPPAELLRLSDGQGIAVLPVTDRGGNPLEQLTTEMVRALHVENIPASYGSAGQSSYLLFGFFTSPPATPALIWILRTREGEEIGRVAQNLPGAQSLNPRREQQLAMARAASSVAALIQDEPVRQSAPPPLYVDQVAGAPGDGNSRLRAAIEQVLPRAGLDLAPVADADSLIVTGAVRLSDVRDGFQTVEIAWTVWDPFGVEVGTIAQARPVAAGSLDTNWGLVANEAALAGAAGIAEMVRQIDWSKGIQPPPG